MDAGLLTKERIVSFFNKYKYNSDLIFHLERKLLKESYDYQKWEMLRIKNSQITRKFFKENDKLIQEYIEPAIQNPEKIPTEALQTYLIQITFFLFENNIDSHIVDDFLEALLKTPQISNEHIKFLALMNLGISKTIASSDTYQNISELFEAALQIFPTYEAAGDEDTQVHLAFCYIYKMLAFSLQKSENYADFLSLYNRFEKLLKSGNENIWKKMWGENADFHFHIELILRYAKIYGIFSAGQNNFAVKPNFSEENKYALNIIINWLKSEFSLESKEGEINLMVFTYYNKYRQANELISKDQFFDILFMKYREWLKLSVEETSYLNPQFAFPEDSDPVDPKFSKMLDKMRLFNRTFSYHFIFLPELYKVTGEQKYQKSIINQLFNFFNKSEYESKGFSTDRFIIDLIDVVSPSLENENEFLLFMQSIFINREISSTIHFGMVSSIAGICFYHLVSKKPDLFIIPDIVPTAQSVTESKMQLLQFVKNASLLHDIGKIGVSQLVNLHFRKITDNEYRRIQEHVIIGQKIVENISYLQHYSDFVIGHHKYWNNIDGYPKCFDLNQSFYKNYINLINICDCLDTSTDARGRNYSKAKNFDEVLTEMKASTNFRYSQDLIALIDQNEDLKTELRTLTSTGRNYNSYQTYMQFVQPHTSFSPQDERSISLYSEEFDLHLPVFYSKCYPNATEKAIFEHIEEITSGNNRRAFIFHNAKKEIFGILSGRIIKPLSGEKNHFIIDEILISPSNRRKGLASELIEVVYEVLAQEEISNIRINVVNDLNFETFFWIEGFSQSNRYLLEKDI